MFESSYQISFFFTIYTKYIFKIRIVHHNYAAKVYKNSLSQIHLMCFEYQSLCCWGIIFRLSVYQVSWKKWILNNWLRMQYCIFLFTIYKIEKSSNISKFPYFNIENASSKINLNNIHHIWQIMYFYIPILFHLCHNCPILRKCIEFHRFRNPNKTSTSFIQNGYCPKQF